MSQEQQARPVKPDGSESFGGNWGPSARDRSEVNRLKDLASGEEGTSTIRTAGVIAGVGLVGAGAIGYIATHQSPGEVRTTEAPSSTTAPKTPAGTVEVSVPPIATPTPEPTPTPTLKPIISLFDGEHLAVDPKTITDEINSLSPQDKAVISSFSIVTLQQSFNACLIGNPSARNITTDREVACEGAIGLSYEAYARSGKQNFYDLSKSIYDYAISQASGLRGIATKQYLDRQLPKDIR